MQICHGCNYHLLQLRVAWVHIPQNYWHFLVTTLRFENYLFIKTFWFLLKITLHYIPYRELLFDRRENWNKLFVINDIAISLFMNICELCSYEWFETGLLSSSSSSTSTWFYNVTFVLISVRLLMTLLRLVTLSWLFIFGIGLNAFFKYHLWRYIPVLRVNVPAMLLLYSLLMIVVYNSS